MGHLLHGSSLALASHVERYGFRTISGNTGGVNVEASAEASRLAAAAAMVEARMIADSVALAMGKEWRLQLQ